MTKSFHDVSSKRAKSLKEWPTREEQETETQLVKLDKEHSVEVTDTEVNPTTIMI